ncbi:hypothetical protein Z946_3553 [Sulfitobacter noctilucicola]|uniref:D-galactarate dehydratase n=1 Tax=Sulfitobacter noctilucicola TaxID=1342301 RepID=A0A7W6Q5W2_9RHOB|nr:hypothetical protein [Sulfitobacter noctilucicola]KIN64661.1 hypothetical protein Z946_3553 [Sulfitobacter noctilucicola]MBB4174190.1 hypothetical protein [Sulfitobacter noctilucicola]
MKQVVWASGLGLLLSGCANVGDFFRPDAPAEVTTAAQTVPAAPEVEAAPLAPATAAPPPPPAARTAEALDTTTPEQRAAAAAPAAADTPKKTLGKTVVSLGSPTEPGLWLKTPLVTAEAQGRVTNPANGKSSLVTLLPLEGPATAGSRMSLAAMRVIDVSLTDLTEVDVALEG